MLPRNLQMMLVALSATPDYQRSELQRGLLEELTVLDRLVDPLLAAKGFPRDALVRPEIPSVSDPSQSWHMLTVEPGDEVCKLCSRRCT